MTFVLFLDIDGCLVLNDMADLPPPESIHDESVRKINALCKEFDVKIVVSSMRRFFHDGMIETRLAEKSDIEDFLKHLGLEVELHDDWYTTEEFTAQNRGEEIQSWQDRHSEISNYIIADDDYCNFTAEQLSRTIKGHSFKGLSDEDYMMVWNQLRLARGVGNKQGSKPSGPAP